MNIDTGKLIMSDLLALMSEEEQKQFKPVPDELAEEAEKELAGKDQTVVDMTKDTPLVQWAKSQRRIKNKKRSNLKAMQTASRKRNRGR